MTILINISALFLLKIFILWHKFFTLFFHTLTAADFRELFWPLLSPDTINSHLFEPTRLQLYVIKWKQRALLCGADKVSALIPISYYHNFSLRAVSGVISTM
jgi:hypothetical protein